MSTISKRIETAINHLIQKDYENALIQISVALDSTGKKKWTAKKTGPRIKDFIKENEKFIYQCASGGNFILRKGGQVNIQGKELKELVYVSVRCSLLHGDELADHVILKPEESFINVEQGKPVINKGLITGLLLSIVGEVANSDEVCGPNQKLVIDGNDILINNLWGNIGKIIETLKFEK